MRKPSGAGASVASGASYQARVASYLLAMAYCEFESAIEGANNTLFIGFETAQNVDDINVRLKDGRTIFIQAKAAIDFSLSSGELRAVFAQFEEQNALGKSDGLFLLATTNRASRRVTEDLRLALDVFRDSPEDAFFQDQPQAICEVIASLRTTLVELQKAAARGSDPKKIDAVIRRSSVVVLDVEDGGVLEQATILALQSKGIRAAKVVWGKMISDCLEFARTRRSIWLESYVTKIERTGKASDEVAKDAAEEAMKMVLGSIDIPCAREVVLCDMAQDSAIHPSQTAIMEFYRFADDCSERINFSNADVRLDNGIAFRVLRRAATFAGLERNLDLEKLKVKGRELLIFEANLDEEIENEPCASRHRDRLRKAIETTEHPLDCVHCGRPVSQPWAEVVEAGTPDRPSLGLVHSTCLNAIDRIVGQAQNPFSERFPDLVNFDIYGWVRAAHDGQRAFSLARSIKSGGSAVQMLWGGPEYRGPQKPFVVEVSLKNGQHEIVTHRNAVHRFTKTEAEEFVADLNASFEEASKAGDPLCYTDKSKGYGNRSVLITQFGADEAINEVSGAAARRFHTQMENDYGRQGSWYAPVIALRLVETGELLDLAGGVPVLTDPVSVARYLDNWLAAGFALPTVETVAVVSDTEFDEMMRVIDEKFECALVDPMLDPGTQELLSGFVLASLSMYGGSERGPSC